MARHTPAARAASRRSAVVAQAQQSLRDLRVAEVVELDVTIDDGGNFLFRTKLGLSFKYEEGR